ncbi:MAG: hypothetical protein MIO92_04580 [Methanosarcinaceae archaeon]|nr:hypothetical protein [Methanosarcinaceae archaeon]
MDFEKMLEIEKAKEKAEKLFPSIPKAVPTMVKTFDSRSIMADLKVMDTQCQDLINKANALTIGTDNERDKAVNISGALQILAKDVKKHCEDFLAPIKKIMANVNGPKKRIIEAADKAKSIVNQKIFQYKKQEEIEAAKQQKLIDEASAKLQASLNVQAKELGIKAPQVAPIQAPKPVTVLRGDAGASVYTRKGWKCEIIDPDLVERQYCVPSQTLLNQAVKMGVRKTPGCRIYQDETPVTRSG